MKIHINTIGCRFNQVETAEMQAILEDSGFKIVPSTELADVYIINTCTVTGNSDHRSKAAIRKAQNLNTLAKIVVTGCFAELNKKEAQGIKGVDLVLGNDEKLKIVEYLQKITGHKNTPLSRKLEEGDKKQFPSYTFQNYKNHSRAFVKIQTGCNNQCSYCIVTIARGDCRSAKTKDVVNQVKILVAKGFQEIVLTGIHIGSFGSDQSPQTNLISLLKTLLEIEGLKRIRLSSISPTEISDALINLIKDSGKICRHLHIPLQSGDDEILSRMRRDYSAQYFHNLIIKLEKQIPDICIGLDVMVGFPGEDEEKFQNTKNLIQNLPITYMHIFRYSKRKGTEAYSFTDTISEAVKKERSQILKELSKKKTLAFRKKQIGKREKIIVESKRDKKTKNLKGLTDNYIPVLIDDKKNHLMNKLTPVKIVDIKDDKMIGEAIDN